MSGESDQLDGEGPSPDFSIVWEWTQQSKCLHTRAGLILDMVGALALFGDQAERAVEITEAVMEALGDDSGAFVAAWKRRFREDPVGATEKWKAVVEPELIRRWMEQ